LILKQIVRSLQNLPILEVKLRLITMLVKTGDPQVPGVLRHLLKSGDLDLQQSAALGCGLIRDHKAVPALINKLSAPPPISYAACFALIKIGSPPALEAVADVLLSADEMLRRAAASALANHPEEGHPAPKDGSTMDDLMVRYATVYGLKRINKRWSAEILDRMRIEEKEWIVRDAAQNAYEDMLSPPPSLPEPGPPLENTPWLIAFAGEQGSGISSGSPETMKILLEALQEGSLAQQAAALYLIRKEGLTDIFPEIYRSLQSQSDSVRGQAALTLWMVASSGVELPPLPV
jgi:HEAT repeat protein